LGTFGVMDESRDAYGTCDEGTKGYIGAAILGRVVMADLAWNWVLDVRS
jgi:hypothetical protein